jgi:hypothetical protein
LIKFPNTVSKWLLPKDVPVDNTISGSAKSLQTCLICVLGIYTLLLYIPESVKVFLQLYSMSELNGSLSFMDVINSFATTFLQLMIGFLLTLNAHRISNFLWKFND